MDFVRRSGWGAAEPTGKPITIATPVKFLFLHHSVTPDNGPETVRSIQRFHQETRGWADLAYNVLYSPKYRTFFEGRGFGIAGAHTRGRNRDSHGLCVLGNFQTDTLPRHAIDDLADFARWHGGTWGPNRYTPHLDFGSTLCPGRALMNVLRDINLYADADTPPTPPPLEYALPPTLREGSTGDDVRKLQQLLMKHDGIYGPMTAAVVREYQRQHGLTVDGICGPQTWTSILGL